MEKLVVFLGMALATYFTRYVMIAALGREMLVLSEAEGPVLSEAEGPVLSEAEGPVLSEIEGPVLSEIEGPSRLRRWLRYVPPAVLAALVVPAVLAPQGHLEVGLPTWAVLLGGAVAWRTRSVLWTIVGGMAAFWLLSMLGA